MQRVQYNISSPSSVSDIFYFMIIVYYRYMYMAAPDSC